ncbi:MAG: FkbM family methyltransferase [Acidobacteria bacterium]|nr:FkbM family methyltransferase [Acidobacteriota bacterium]
MDRRSFVAGLVAGASGVAIGGAGAWPRPTPPPAPPPPAPKSPGRLSFSQQGEDIVLFHLLRDLMKIDRPTYVDIGAADPIQSNNTYMLHWSSGGHGVLVEPNPMYQERLHMHRPHDVIVNVGIGVTDATEADYYVIRGQPALNTFSADQVKMLRGKANEDVVERVIKMPLISVNHLIEKYLGQAPDLVSIDIEGMDLAVLRTLNFKKYRPASIIAETIRMGTAKEDSSIAKFLAAKGYEVRGGSLYNTIFADPARYA